MSHTFTPPGSPLPDQDPSRQAAAMRFVMIVVLLDMLAVGIIVPVLPTMLGQFVANPTEQAKWYSVVVMSYAVAQFVSAPLLGALSDRFGRRPVLLMGFCGMALNFFATALATSIATLVLSRVVGGMMQANAAVANAYVADITPAKDRAKRFGLLGAMFGIGFILGPVLGGVLGGMDIRLPFFVAGGLSLLNLLYGIFVLPESLPPARRRPVDWLRANPLSAFQQLAALKGVGLLMGVLALAGLAQFCLYTVWVLYGSLRFGWGPAESGWSLFAVGIVSAVVQGALLGRLLKRFTAQRLAVMGLLSSSVAFLLWGLATQTWMMYAVIFANVLGSAVAASLQGLVSSAANEREQGRIMGAVSSLSSLMAVLAPVFAGPLLMMVSHLPRSDWRVGAPMFFCALLQAGAMLFALAHFRRLARQPTQATPSATFTAP